MDLCLKFGFSDASDIKRYILDRYIFNKYIFDDCLLYISKSQNINVSVIQILRLFYKTS